MKPPEEKNCSTCKFRKQSKTCKERPREATGENVTGVRHKWKTIENCFGKKIEWCESTGQLKVTVTRSTNTHIHRFSIGK